MWGMRAFERTVSGVFLLFLRRSGEFFFAQAAVFIFVLSTEGFFGHGGVFGTLREFFLAELAVTIGVFFGKCLGRVLLFLFLSGGVNSEADEGDHGEEGCDDFHVCWFVFGLDTPGFGFGPSLCDARLNAGVIRQFQEFFSIVQKLIGWV